MEGILVSSKNSITEKQRVSISITDQALIVSTFETKVLLFRISINEIRFYLGGNNQSLLFIQASSLFEDSLYLEANFKNLKEIKQKNSLLGQKLSLIEKQKNHFVRRAVLILFLTFMAVSLLFHFRREIFSSFSVLVPFSVEKAVADQFFNPKLNSYQKESVEKMGNLLNSLKFPNHHWKPAYTYHISSETVPNAYATLGGHIFINKGLILLLDNTEDLLGVLAHEMIHVQKRHVVKSIFQSLGVYASLSLLFGDITGLAAVFIDQGGGALLNLQYSRVLEDEADQIAMEILAFNKIDPIGLARSLELINLENQKLIKQAPGSEILEKLQKIEILNSHPEIEKRIANLKKQRETLIQKNSVLPVAIFDYNSFKKQVKEHF